MKTFSHMESLSKLLEQSPKLLQTLKPGAVVTPQGQPM